MQFHSLMIDPYFFIRKLYSQYALFIYGFTDNSNLFFRINHNAVTDMKLLAKIRMLFNRFCFYNFSRTLLCYALFRIIKRVVSNCFLTVCSAALARWGSTPLQHTILTRQLAGRVPETFFCGLLAVFLCEALSRLLHLEPPL